MPAGDEDAAAPPLAPPCFKGVLEYAAKFQLSHFVSHSTQGSPFIRIHSQTSSKKDLNQSIFIGQGFSLIRIHRQTFSKLKFAESSSDLFIRVVVVGVGGVVIGGGGERIVVRISSLSSLSSSLSSSSYQPPPPSVRCV